MYIASHTNAKTLCLFIVVFATVSVIFLYEQNIEQFPGSLVARFSTDLYNSPPSDSRLNQAIDAVKFEEKRLTSLQSTNDSKTRNGNSKFNKQNAPPGYKTIVLHNPDFMPPIIFDKSHCGDCRIIKDEKQTKMWDSSTGAILISWKSGVLRNLPGIEKRRPDQLLVWWAMESPSITLAGDGPRGRYRGYPPGFFNATFSFRRDSTFYNPVWRWFTNVSVVNFVTTGWHGVERDASILMTRKSKMAVWLVSNCAWGSNTKRRIEYSNQLIASGLKLDRFGNCFAKSGPTPKRNTPEFFRMVERYKFYMSFENSLHCRDYVTEKFYINGLASGAVPVVFGARKKDYEDISPPHSFIFAEDFRSPKQLVNYLRYLERNDTAYLEYLAWRKMDPSSNFPYGKYLGFCALCRTLHGVARDDRKPFWEIYKARNSTYPSGRPLGNYRMESLHNWWEGSQPDECLVAKTPKAKT